MLRTFDGSCANTVEANGTLQEFAAGGSKANKAQSEERICLRGADKRTIKC